MTADQMASADWSETKRRRILRLVLGIIAGWNLLFIPLGIYVWPRLPRAVAAPSRGASSFIARLPLQTPVAAEQVEPAVGDDPVTDELSRVLSQLTSEAIDPADEERLAAFARRALDGSGGALSLDALLNEIDKPAGGDAPLTPESFLESVAALAKRAEEAKRDASNDELELSEIGYRISKQDKRSWQFEWRCSILNKTKQARQVACYVKFLDKDGVLVGEAYKLSSFPAGLKQAVRGTADIDLPYARDVVDVEVTASTR